MSVPHPDGERDVPPNMSEPETLVASKWFNCRLWGERKHGRHVRVMIGATKKLDIAQSTHEPRAIFSPHASRHWFSVTPASNLYLCPRATPKRVMRNEETGETPVLPYHPFLELVTTGAIGGQTPRFAAAVLSWGKMEPIAAIAQRRFPNPRRSLLRLSPVKNLPRHPLCRETLCRPYSPGSTRHIG